MATRRPRVKVAANLSIRRPTKSNNNTPNVAGETIKQEADVTAAEPAQEIVLKDVVEPSTVIATAAAPSKDGPMPERLQDVKAIVAIPTSMPEEAPPEETFQEFKLPKPPDVNPPTASPLALPGYEINPNNLPSNSFNNQCDEPMSPRKQDASRPPTFTLPLARKRNRTESLTSNKSLPEGVTVNKVTRKLATKQEESQRTLDNKKEIRKRLTNIENVDKQNLTMFDMIYYNPVNNPMTPPTHPSKRGSQENIANAVDGGGARSRSVSKSRSPTPAPSGSAPMAPPKPVATPAPVTLTPQLKLGPNGEMILDEASLVIENEREKEMRETLANADIVYQDEFSGNSGYYSRIRRTKDWGDEETIRFYRCLHTIGTDFSMMLTLFPQRSRRDLKLKFKKEERINLNLVNKALLHPNEFNVDDLRQQFAEEDEQLEKQRQEEQQRKMEAVEQQQKEKLRKNLMMRMSASNNPQRRLSKSVRAMSDGLELAGEEPQKPKRRTTSKKRPKTDSDPIASNITAKTENEQQPMGTDSEGNTIALEGVTETVPVNTEPNTDNAHKEEASKKRKRAPVPRKRATAKQAAAVTTETVTSAVVKESNEEQQAASYPEEKASISHEFMDNSVPVNALTSSAQYEEPSSPSSKRRHTVKQEAKNVVSNTVEEAAQQQSVYVPERSYHISSILSENTDNIPIDTAPTDTFQAVSVHSAPKKPPTPVSTPAYWSPAPLNYGPQEVQGDSIENDSPEQEEQGGLVRMDERTNTPAQTPKHHGGNNRSRSRRSKKNYWKKKRFYGRPRPQFDPSYNTRKAPQKLIDLPRYDDAVIVKKHTTEYTKPTQDANAAAESQNSKRKYWQKKRFYGKPRPQLGPAKRKEKPPPEKQELIDLPRYDDAVIVKKDVTEEPVPADDNVSPEGPFDVPPETNAFDQPYVAYEPAAVSTYENAANLDLPIVKYQCMEEYDEEDGYRPSSPEMKTTAYVGSTAGGTTNTPTTSATVHPEQEEEDDSVTVITLQNLDDQTHTTCLRTDVAQSVQPTLINELTPVEIKYDEYDPDGALVLALDGDQDSIVKEEQQLYNASQSGAPLNVQVINWPPEAGSSTLPYVVYGNLETYGCSSNTVIIPDNVRDHVVEYAPLSQTIVNIAPMVEQTGTPLAPVASIYSAGEVANVAPGQSNVQTSSFYSADASIVQGNVEQPSSSATTSCYSSPVGVVTPKHELENPPAQSNVLPPSTYDALERSTSEAEPCPKSDPVELSVEAGNGEERQEEEENEEEEDGEGGFSLDDIDINSLVLVESQDSVDPNKTFYEIYISNPDTGQLSEKPLDVPADVIESIRQILEGAGGGGAGGEEEEEEDDDR